MFKMTFKSAGFSSFICKFLRCIRFFYGFSISMSLRRAPAECTARRLAFSSTVHEKTCESHYCTVSLKKRFSISNTRLVKCSFFPQVIVKTGKS